MWLEVFGFLPLACAGVGPKPKPTPADGRHPKTNY